MAQSTPRKRVTREDIRKREIKLDIVERKPAPPLSKRFMAFLVLPVALWWVIPSQGALWVALEATIAFIMFADMFIVERRRDDFDTGREFGLAIATMGALGLTIGCWAFVLTKVFAA
jgi:hypothetical protein